MKPAALPRGSLIIPPGAAFELARAYSSGGYTAARNDRFRKLYGPTQSTPEEHMLPSWDRLRVIAYLRQALRNNPVVAGIVKRWALGIGSPTVHVEVGDPESIDIVERYLLHQLARIGHQSAATFDEINLVISAEYCLAGEVFLVWVDGNRVQMVPSEMCGSPLDQRKRLPNEADGIVVDPVTGRPIAYRFGRRDLYSQINYEDGQLVPAEAVWHLANIDRVEQRRGVPLMASAIPALEDLDNITESKVQQVKNQASLSMFVTKNIDPQTAAEMAAMPGMTTDPLMQRSNHQEIRTGTIMYGELGEDVRMLSPNINAADFDSFQLSRLEVICASIGIPPEEAVVGYRRSNYSSARADKLRWKQVVEWEQKRREPWATDLVMRILAVAAATGALPADPPSADDISWGWPPIREIDEQRHVAAVVELYKTGLTSKKDIHGERAQYWEQVERQRIREAAMTARMLRDAANEFGLTVQEVQARLPETWIVTDQEAARAADRAEGREVPTTGHQSENPAES